MRRVLLTHHGVQVRLLHRNRPCALRDVFHHHGVQTSGLEQLVVNVVQGAVGALGRLQVNRCPSGELDDRAGDQGDWFWD